MKRVAALSLSAVLTAALLAGCSSNKPMDQGNNQGSSSQMMNDHTGGSQSNLPTTYTMQAGDTLKSIAQQFYGSQDKWKLIYRANADKLTSTKAIHVGLKLTIPRESSAMTGGQMNGASQGNMNQKGSMNDNKPSGSSASDNDQNNQTKK